MEERTQLQVSNAREAEVQKGIPGRVLGEELKRISGEDSPSEIIKGLETAGLLELFSQHWWEQNPPSPVWRAWRR